MKDPRDEDLKPEELGVYITSDESHHDPNYKGKGKKSFDKFCFETPEDVADFIAENAGVDDFVMIYGNDFVHGVPIMRLIWSGTKQELEEDDLGED